MEMKNKHRSSAVAEIFANQDSDDSEFEPSDPKCLNKRFPLKKMRVAKMLQSKKMNLQMHHCQGTC